MGSHYREQGVENYSIENRIPGTISSTGCSEVRRRTTAISVNSFKYIGSVIDGSIFNMTTNDDVTVSRTCVTICVTYYNEWILRLVTCLIEFCLVGITWHTQSFHAAEFVSATTYPWYGGLAIYIYISEKFNCSTIDLNINSQMWEGQFIEIANIESNKSLIIGNVYRPPNNTNSLYQDFTN